MNLWQRFKLWAIGDSYVGHRTCPGWKSSLPFYRVRCPKHGLVESHLHGYDQRLECPICKNEERSKKNEASLSEAKLRTVKE